MAHKDEGLVGHNELVLQTALSHKNLLNIGLQPIATNSVSFWYINEKCFVNRGPATVVYLSSICEETLICINNCGFNRHLSRWWYLLGKFYVQRKIYLHSSKKWKILEVFFKILEWSACSSQTFDGFQFSWPWCSQDWTDLIILCLMAMEMLQDTLTV